MKWIKATERLPELNKEISFRIYERRYAGSMKEPGVFYHNGYACTYGAGSVEWLDESPESPSPSLQEAAEAASFTGLLDWLYENNWQVAFYKETPHYYRLYEVDKVKKIEYRNSVELFALYVQSLPTGWNAREAQQTGPILTREVFDKIWDGGHARGAQAMQSLRTGGAYKVTAPDKETFYKSLNL